MSRQRDKDIGNWMGMGFSLLSQNCQLSPKLRKRGWVPYLLKMEFANNGDQTFLPEPWCWQAALSADSASSFLFCERGQVGREGSLLKLAAVQGLWQEGVSSEAHPAPCENPPQGGLGTLMSWSSDLLQREYERSWENLTLRVSGSTWA